MQADKRGCRDEVPRILALKHQHMPLQNISKRKHKQQREQTKRERSDQDQKREADRLSQLAPSFNSAIVPYRIHTENANNFSAAERMKARKRL